MTIDEQLVRPAVITMLDTIVELEKRIGELTAERDEARHRNAQVELEAVEYSNRMHDAVARAEAAEAALTVECQRIRDLEDDRDSWRYIAEASRKAGLAEHQRRKECEAALERLDTNGDSDIGRKLSRAYFIRYPS